MPAVSIIEEIERVLGDYPEVHFCTLFGSAANQRLSPHSDIDIAVASDREFSAESKIHLSQALSAALKREVDLIDLRRVSGLILEQALCKAIIVKNADPSLYAGLLKRLWYSQADMMPYVRRIFEQRSRQWLR